MCDLNRLLSIYVEQNKFIWIDLVPCNKALTLCDTNSVPCSDSDAEDDLKQWVAMPHPS